MKIWQLRFSSDGRHPLFPTERARRAAVVVLVLHAGPWLVSFGIVDDHLHVVVTCSRERAGKLSRAILLGMRPLVRCGFEPSYLAPVESRVHLQRLVSYCIEQPARHGLDVQTALWSGSCFSDLVGARVIDGLRLRVGDVLPRYRVAAAWLAVGCAAGGGVAPVTDAQILGTGLTALRDEAAFATCASPQLEGKTARETAARAAVVTLARRAGYRSMDIASALGITPEAVRQLGHRPTDHRVLGATWLRLAIVGANPKLSAR